MWDELNRKATVLIHKLFCSRDLSREWAEKIKLAQEDSYEEGRNERGTTGDEQNETQGDGSSD